MRIRALTATLTLFACGSSVETGDGMEQSLEVVSFSAAPNPIPPEAAATLIWEVRGADTVTITDGLGAELLSTDMLAGSIPTPSLERSIDYILTAVRAEDSISRRITITVAEPGVPLVVSFEAQPATVLIGGRTTLSWFTQDANSVTITDDRGMTLGSGMQPGSGAIEVTVEQTTEYTLVAQGDSGDSAPERATVTAVEPIAIEAFTASPNPVAAGAPTVVTWDTSRADSVTIVRVGGGQLLDSGPADGSRELMFDETTTLRLEARAQARPNVTADLEIIVQ